MRLLRSGTLLLAIVCTAPAYARGSGGLSGFSLNEFAGYLGSYRLIKEKRGHCHSSFIIGVGQIGNEKDGYRANPGVLEIGGSSFSGFNEGWREYDNGNTWSRRRADVTRKMFTGLPVLKGRWEKETRSTGRRTEREMKLEAHRNGELEVEIEMKVRGRERYHEKAKCIYVKDSETPAERPIEQPPKETPIENPKDEPVETPDQSPDQLPNQELPGK